jgi:hypothetical protein
MNMPLAIGRASQPSLTSTERITAGASVREPIQPAPHPLCFTFGELDDEDHRKGRPFRTALVYAKETTRPGQGFFDTITALRNKPIDRGQHDKVWTDELNAVFAHYNSYRQMSKEAAPEGYRRGAECRKSFGEAFAPASSYSSF